MKKLTKLNLSHNKLKTLPDDFCELTALQVVNLSHNELVTVSEKLGDLVMLQQLVIKLMNSNNLFDE